MRPQIAALAVLLLCPSARAAEPGRAERQSGYEQMSVATRAMQDDDRANPGMLWVLEGESLWEQKAGRAAKSCAGCHLDPRASMAGVARRYPNFDLANGRPISLEQRINACRVERQDASPLPWESRELLALTALIANQSRGMAIAPTPDSRLKTFIEAGRHLFVRRFGQFNIACTQCHDENAGKRLGGSFIPQGHPTGYPIYRLEWQTMGSLQRRIRGCMASLRAEPFDYGSPELVNLELFLMERARGMTVESPAVRP